MNPVFTPHAPKPLGPYSQAVRTGDWLFVAGQLPLDPVAGSLISGGMPEQAALAIQNLAAVMEAAGSSLSAIVKTTVYVTDLKEFAELNAVYAKHFLEPFPARAVVQVAALPTNAKLEIEAVAWLGSL